ncbi:sulfotransferase family protein [Alphaproteobacteria bacterium]|nr:sulfotransferase family protein [Alphaproteobacteria bacterium]
MSIIQQSWRHFRFHISHGPKPCLYFPKHGVVYINNPKSACSTIKRALTGDYETSSHDFHLKCRVNHTVYNNGEIPAATPCIFISRDPVSRFLSCYTDKVRGGLYNEIDHGQTRIIDNKTDKKKVLLVRGIRSELNLPDGSPISIDEFIEYVHGQFLKHGTNQVNPHYRPQTDILNQAIVRPDFIGRLEDMPTLWDRLQSEYNFTAPIFRSMNTSKHRVSLRKSQIKLIQDLYKIDLDTLNY